MELRFLAPVFVMFFLTLVSVLLKYRMLQTTYSTINFLTTSVFKKRDLDLKAKANVNVNVNLRVAVTNKNITKLPPPKRPLQKPIFLCGYEVPYLAPNLYPDAPLIDLGNASNLPYLQVALKEDVMIFGLHGNCDKIVAERFPGTIVYINGEPDYGRNKVTTSCSRMYFGPTSIELLPAKRQFYYAQAVSQGGDLREALMEAPSVDDPIPEHFLIYRNSHCVGYREAAFVTIAEKIESELRKEDVGSAGGGCFGSRKDLRIERKKTHWQDFKYMQNEYRFTLTMESKVLKGYISEKIVVGFASKSIPIYYGTKEVFDLFNPEAFIFYDPANPEPALEQILYLETNETAYREMRARPRVTPEAYKSYFSIGPSAGELNDITLREEIQKSIANCDKLVKNNRTHLLNMPKKKPWISRPPIQRHSLFKK